MNQPQTYMEHAPASAPGSGIGQYSYGQPQALQPASQSYPPGGYAAYQYPSTMAPMAQGHTVTSSMGSQMVQQPLPLPAMASGQPTPAAQQQFQQHIPDTSGQVAPPGMKPRVTATLWEDEGSLCFQVEAKGVCVARREDNHMINGTKLLNVAGMTRGRRDGILKSEKTRHVVKIGPMHLKGVWIPFDRALDFANKEHITEMLYPLFVHNIGALLYHPTNQARQQSIGNAAMAARKSYPEADYMRTPTSSQPPALTHHHSMSNPGVTQPPHSMAPHPASGRPGLDRAHTFPTPPTSASSATMNMGSSGSSYEYGGGQSTAMQSGQHIPVNAVVSRSMPTTPPASTSPGGAPQMQYPTTQAYDGSRPMYTAPGSAYSQYSGSQYGQVPPGSGVKTEMAPPARAGAEGEHADHKAHSAYQSQHDGDAEHEGEYTHTSASYGARKASYTGMPNAPLGPMHSDPSQISPEMTHSPHQNGSGRATPRTTTTYPGYSTQQRAQLPSSNLYSVISNDARAGAPNGAESYQPQGYTAQYPSMNGVPQSNKRGREMDDEDQYGRPLSANGIKRARTDGGSVSAPRPMPQQQAVKPIR